MSTLELAAGKPQGSQSSNPHSEGLAASIAAIAGAFRFARAFQDAMRAAPGSMPHCNVTDEAQVRAAFEASQARARD